MWYIQDWAGNVLDFKGRFLKPEFSVAEMFPTFEGAWEHLYELYPNSNDDFFDHFEVINENGG